MDRKLLLSIQSACNTSNIKLPWDKIAELMGNDISEGAIVQHLAKTRIRAVEAGLDVPPPLRRGGTALGPKVTKTQTKPRATAETQSGNDKTNEEDTEFNGNAARQRGTTGAMSMKSEPKIKMEPKSDLESDTGSDGDYSDNESPVKKKATSKREPHVEYDTEIEDEEPADRNTPNSGKKTDTDSSDTSSEYVAVGAPFLELAYDNSNATANTGSNTMATTSPLVSDRTMTSSSRRESNSSESKVVKIRVPGENLKLATSNDGMDRTPAFKAEYPQVGNTFGSEYGDGNSMGISAAPPTQTNPAWGRNFQAGLPTLDGLHLNSGWPENNAMNVPTTGYSMPSYASQNAHGASQFQYPYTSMPMTTASTSTTQGGLYQGMVETTHAMEMNSFSAFQPSSNINDTLVPDSFSDFMRDDIAFEGKEAVPP